MAFDKNVPVRDCTSFFFSSNSTGNLIFAWQLLRRCFLLSNKVKVWSTYRNQIEGRALLSVKNAFLFKMAHKDIGQNRRPKGELASSIFLELSGVLRESWAETESDEYYISHASCDNILSRLYLLLLAASFRCKTKHFCNLTRKTGLLLLFCWAFMFAVSRKQNSQT